MITVSDDELIARLEKIADAGRRADGTDIPLGQELRLAIDRIRSLSESKGELEQGLRMIRDEARTSNSVFGRSDMKALRDIAEIADYALAPARAVIAKEAGHAE